MRNNDYNNLNKQKIIEINEEEDYKSADNENSNEINNKYNNYNSNYSDEDLNGENNIKKENNFLIEESDSFKNKKLKEDNNNILLEESTNPNEEKFLTSDEINKMDKEELIKMILNSEMIINEKNYTKEKVEKNLKKNKEGKFTKNSYEDNYSNNEANFEGNNSLGKNIVYKTGNFNLDIDESKNSPTFQFNPYVEVSKNLNDKGILFI